MKDRSYVELPHSLSEIEHTYGDKVHLLADPYAATLLARLCESECVQPEVNRLVRRLYERLMGEVINHLFPRHVSATPTRMAAGNARAVVRGDFITRSTQVVTVDIARAGILPSLVCYEMLNELMTPRQVRQDHLMVSRSTDESEHVKGAEITGGKIGGPVDGRIVLFPDPMGATGSSLSAAIGYYKETYGANALAMATLNLIVTPQFIKKMQTDHPDVSVYALRVDRGMSDDEVLATVPGTHWEKESGLNDKDYIIPGGGGFGEIMNNAWV